MTTNDPHSQVTMKGHVMPYKFTPAAPDSDTVMFADMKEFRAAFSPLVLTVKGTNVTLDDTVFGKLTYIKPAGTPPTFVQPDVTGERPSLDEVLADIDALEDEDTEPEIGAARRAGIPLLDEPVAAIQDASGAFGSSNPEINPRARRERRTSSPRFARMSHKNCGHAITGEEGKIARAECRARQRAAMDQAEAG